MFNSLVDLVSGSAWAYAALFGIAALDAVFPLVPSETAVITGGVIAAAGDLNLGLVLACAAAGAFVGDNTSYVIGRTIGPPAADRLFRGERGRKTINWAKRTLAERGGLLIVVSRFIPGGRTATTFSAGLVGYRWRLFVLFDALAAAFWASYAALIGYFGGKAFENQPWKGLLVAFGLAATITLVVEVGRRLRARLRSSEAG